MIVHLAPAGGEMGSPDERTHVAKLQDEISAAIDAMAVGEFDGDERAAVSVSSTCTAQTPTGCSMLFVR